MKQHILFFILIAFPVIHLQGQSANDSALINKTQIDTLSLQKNESVTVSTIPGKDSIEIINSKGDIKGYKNGQLLNNWDYYYLFKENKPALHEISLANFNYNVGKYFAYMGGFVFGFCLGSAISGDQIDESWGWTLATSAAVVGVGFIIYNSGKSHHRKAIDIYNSSIKSTSSKIPQEIKFGCTHSGLGLVYRF